MGIRHPVKVKNIEDAKLLAGASEECTGFTYCYSGKDKGTVYLAQTSEEPVIIKYNKQENADKWIYNIPLRLHDPVTGNILAICDSNSVDNNYNVGSYPRLRVIFKIINIYQLG